MQPSIDAAPRPRRRAMEYLVFPLVLGGALAIAWAVHAQGGPPPVVVLISVAIAATAIAFLEKFQPYAAYWSRPHRDVRTDSLHMFFSVILPPPVVDGLLAAMIPLLLPLLPASGLSGMWPTDWWFPLQLALALVLAEATQYWIHRAMHEVPLLWRLHAVHHGAPRLYWLNAGRFHPLDTALSYAISSAPLWLLGCPQSVLTMFAVFTGVHGMLQHCNIALRLGPLNWIFSMSELHRWHHSRDVEIANGNYGANIILWDIVFGTRMLPADRPHRAEDVGYHGDDRMPEHFLGQIAAPFRARHFMEGAGEARATIDAGPLGERTGA